MKKGIPAPHGMKYVYRMFVNFIIEDFKQVSHRIKANNDVSVCIVIQGAFIFGAAKGTAYILLGNAVPESSLVKLNIGEHIRPL
jgi:hypothetical protein